MSNKPYWFNKKRNRTWRVFDIETVPLETIPKELEDRLINKVPSNISDPVKIKARIEQNKKNLEKEKNLNPYASFICCLCLLGGDDELLTFTATNEDEERELLCNFWEVFMFTDKLIGFNTKGFDLPFIIARSWLLNPDVEIPGYDSLSKNLYPYSTHPHFDLSYVLSFQKHYYPKNLWCKIFGIDCKDDFDGSMVAEAYKKGDMDSIIAHCQDDVRVERELYYRVEPWYLKVKERLDQREEQEG